MSVLAVSDEALLKAWGNANFGSIAERSIESKRRLLAMSAIKVQAGWHVGSTSTDILLELELFKELGFRRMGVMTTRGRTFVWQTLHRESYQDDVYLLGEVKEKINNLEARSSLSYAIDLENKVKKLEAWKSDVMHVINESSGVAGYHLNGEIATWGELGLEAES